MTKRFTTRLQEPVIRLIMEKSKNEKKSISEVIAELASAKILKSEKEEISTLAKSVSELSSALSNLHQEFLLNEETLQRELRMILNLLVIENAIAKQILSTDQYDAAWARFESKLNEYKTTGRISL